MPRPPRALALLLSAFLAAAAGAGCGGESAAKTKIARGDAGPRVVTTLPAEQAALPQVVTVSGTLAAEDEVELGLKAPGRIGALLVDLGSVVRAGQPLARLDPTDFRHRARQAEAALQQARARLGLDGTGGDDRVVIEETAVVRQARAQLDEARLRRERFARLFEEKLVSEAERDTAEAAFLVADSRYQDALEEARNRAALLAQRRSELDLSRQQLEDAVLVAPFEGAIRERHVTLGQYVTAGQPVVTLVRLHPLRLRVDVPEREAARVRGGQEVRVTVEGDPATYSGRVARLSPAITEASRTLAVEAEVPNPDGRLRPGSFARAEIVTAADQPAVLVPRSAVTTFAGIEKVLLVADGKAVERRVVVGRRVGERIEIEQGLKAGEIVITDPGNLVGGQPVAPGAGAAAPSAAPAPEKAGKAGT